MWRRVVWSMRIDVSEEPASSIIRVHDRVSGPLRNIGTLYRTTWYHILGGDRITKFPWNTCTSTTLHIHNTPVLVNAMRTTCVSAEDTLATVVVDVVVAVVIFVDGCGCCYFCGRC
jgi:hypothetical protein